MYNFKTSHNFDKRKSESSRIMKKYPDKLPVIVEKMDKSDVPLVDKNKYLVPRDITIGQFLYVIRKRIVLSPEKALYIFIRNKLPPTSASMSQIYELYKDDDGFLYVLYAGETTFG